MKTKRRLHFHTSFSTISVWTTQKSIHSQSQTLIDLFMQEKLPWCVFAEFCIHFFTRTLVSAQKQT